MLVAQQEAQQQAQVSQASEAPAAAAAVVAAAAAVAAACPGRASVQAPVGQQWIERRSMHLGLKVLTDTISTAGLRCGV